MTFDNRKQKTTLAPIPNLAFLALWVLVSQLRYPLYMQPAFNAHLGCKRRITWALFLFPPHLLLSTSNFFSSCSTAYKTTIIFRVYTCVQLHIKPPSSSECTHAVLQKFMSYRGPACGGMQTSHSGVRLTLLGQISLSLQHHSIAS